MQPKFPGVDTVAKENKTNAMRIIETVGIAYTMHSYEAGDGAIDGHAVAAKIGLSPSQVYKTLVTKGTGRDLFVFVIPVDAELDLKKAARTVGEKSVEMIHVADINRLTGYIRGGCSPVGMKKQYVTVIHQAALEQPTITVSAGRIGLQVEVAPRDLAGLVGAQFADLVRG